MRYLIDGYNLLFATGRLTARSGQPSLQPSRKWLLVEVVRAHGVEASSVTVVFDAARAPQTVAAEEQHGGVHVLYARGQTADDLIEQLIREESNPRALTVVSDDNRIKSAGKRRGCEVLGCLDYCERCWQPRPEQSEEPPRQLGKPDRSTAEETRRWLEVFGETDPEWDEPF